MSVLIKGITLEQFYRDLNNVRDMDVGWDAVQLPPHGRLIDADASLKSISRAIEDDSDIADVYEEDYELVNDWLASAPTIIEAEEGE